MHQNPEAYERLVNESEKDLLIGLVISQEVTEFKLDELKTGFERHISHHWKAEMVVVGVLLSGALTLSIILFT